jgi:hypothetical protein
MMAATICRIAEKRNDVFLENKYELHLISVIFGEKE